MKAIVVEQKGGQRDQAGNSQRRQRSKRAERAMA
jgi:hypothetical protein